MEDKSELEKLRSFVCSTLKDPVRAASQLPDEVLKDFLTISKRNGLNPFAGDVYLLPFWSKEDTQWCVRWVRVVSYHKLLGCVMEEQDFGGLTIVKHWENPDPHDPELGENLLAVTARVHLTSLQYPIEVTVYMKEFRRGGPMWGVQGKPYFLLEKCAVAAVCRRAKPNKCSGVYSFEEIDERVTVQENLEVGPPTIEKEIVGKHITKSHPEAAAPEIPETNGEFDRNAVLVSLLQLRKEGITNKGDVDIEGAIRAVSSGRRLPKRGVEKLHNLLKIVSDEKLPSEDTKAKIKEVLA